MQNAALSVFQSNYLQGKISDFYDQFAAASEGGLTADKIAALKEAYAKLITNAAIQYSNLTKVVGDPAITASATTLSGQIKGITADQANVLTGSINGLRLTQLDTNVILRPIGKTIHDGLIEFRAQTLLQIKIENNTKVTADNTGKMVDVLNLIQNNQGTI